MEDLTESRYVPLIGWGMMTRIIGPRQPVQWIAVDDIGAVATAAFADPARFVGRTVTLAGDSRTLPDTREVFRRVDGKAPFSLFMPARLFGRVVSKDLLTMWYWLHEHTFEADIDAVRTIRPTVMNLETWLRQKRGTKAMPVRA
jgi:uncharacterized protein YbjT (DUF2867 family)